MPLGQGGRFWFWGGRWRHESRPLCPCPGREAQCPAPVARPILASARPTLRRAGRRRRDPRGAYRSPALRSSRSRWRSSSSIMYGCMVPHVAPAQPVTSMRPGAGLGTRSAPGRPSMTEPDGVNPLASAGRETVTARPVTCRRGLPARASALAPTTSGSRGSGGRASPQGRSRRALGLWTRMRFTVTSSPGRHAQGLVDDEPRPCLGIVLRGTVRADAGGGHHPTVRIPVESSAACPWARQCQGRPPGARWCYAGIGCEYRVKGSGRAGGPG
jgi:hypothetical protein